MGEATDGALDESLHDNASAPSPIFMCLHKAVDWIVLWEAQAFTFDLGYFALYCVNLCCGEGGDGHQVVS